MSSLGYQLIYRLMNRHPDVGCERIFLDEKGQPTPSLETGRRISDFDLLAFSISFELDYFNLPKLLRRAGTPLLSRDRGRYDPIVIAGGIAPSLNPEPIAELIDLFVVGEAEPLLPELLDRFLEWKRRRIDRNGLLRSLSSLPGVYVPLFHEGERVRWLRAPDLDEVRPCSVFASSDAEFSDMWLIELVRGCGRGCRFCAADFSHRPPRFLSVETALKLAKEGLRFTRKIGLLGATISDHPEIEEIAWGLVRMGCRISAASLRADSLTPSLLKALAEGGHRTLTLAPETADERLKRTINKPIGDDSLLRAIETALSAGIPNIKLYFMIGLPGEGADEVESIAGLVGEVKKLMRPWGGKLSVTISPFVPKPHTPLQWAGMEDEKGLSEKLRFLRRELGRLKVELPSTSARLAILEGLLSRGDRKLTPFIIDVAQGIPWRQALKRNKIDIDLYLGEKGVGDPLPWDFIDVGIDKGFLIEEYRRSKAGEITPRCLPGVSCPGCGGCGFSRSIHRSR